jgi:hypothetical protein
VTLMSKAQLSQGSEQVRAKAVKARQQARQQAGQAATKAAAKAAAQAAPIAVATKLAARQGVHSMRAWAAPRLEQSGQTLEKKVAPRMSAMMTSAARKIEPPRPRRRWPFFMAGLVALSAAAGAAFMSWRSSQAKEQQSQAAAEAGETGETTMGESNAKVRTP